VCSTCADLWLLRLDAELPIYMIRLP
jgi:hypothetical protein